MNENELIDNLINRIVDLKQQLEEQKDTMYRVGNYLREHNITITIHNDKTIMSELDNEKK